MGKTTNIERLTSRAMVGIAALVALALASIAPPALAGSPTIEPRGTGSWCKGAHHPRSVECGAVGNPARSSEPARVYLFRASATGRVRNFAYRVCSEAPSGNERCIPRRTAHTADRRINPWKGYASDRFRFASAFPHRIAGIYKVRWFRGGEQIGKTIRVKLTPDR